MVYLSMYVFQFMWAFGKMWKNKFFQLATLQNLSLQTYDLQVCFTNQKFVVQICSKYVMLFTLKNCVIFQGNSIFTTKLNYKFLIHEAYLQSITVGLTYLEMVQHWLCHIGCVSVPIQPQTVSPHLAWLSKISTTSRVMQHNERENSC